MPISLKCEQCYRIKPCTLFLDQDREGAVIYLCRPCARELGFVAGDSPSRAATRWTNRRMAGRC